MIQMKLKWILGAIVTIIVLSFSAFIFKIQAHQDYTPSEAVTNYYTAAKNGDIKEAERYVATEVLEVYEKRNNPWIGTLKADITKEGQKYKKVKPISENIQNETATVKVELSHKGEMNYKSKEDYLLIKENDGWKLTFQ